MKNILYCFLAILPILFSVPTYGQEAQDTVVVEVEGKKYYQFIVQQGNTLYSIAKQYGVSVNDITESNAKSKEGLSIGDTLLILIVAEDKQAMQRKMEVDGNIIVHEVQKGQTLYAISKIYNIGTGDILAVNPEIKGGLKEGQLIKIPVAKLKEEVPEPLPEVVEEKKVFIHVVKQKETLYSISRFYGVSVDKLKEANTGLSESLKTGQEIIIPDREVDEFTSPDTTELKEKYRIGLILPMFLDLNDTLISKLKIDDKESVLPSSVVGIQFYEGFKLIMDSIDPDGSKFELNLFDGAKDSVYVKSLCEGPLKEMDLIIGPFYYSQFLEVAAMANREKIHIVCPVPQNNKVLLGNPYVSKIATSQNIVYRNLAAYLSKFYKTENVIVVTKSFRVNPLNHSFKEALQEMVASTGDSNTAVVIHELKWDNGSVQAVGNLLKEDIFNIIILPSDDQAYVTEFLSNLNLIKKEYMILVIGVDRWLRYTNIDFEYFENLNAMIPVDGYTDFNNEATQNFIISFNKKYKQFPEKYTFIGADIAMYYPELLIKYGTRIENGLVNEKRRGLYYRFNYFKTGIESGYENESVFFLKQDLYELVEVQGYK